ncbi:hypothetical protein P43SY_005940 [Pythium insidiosum]|uniref:PROP1-like PPR domain-containing protein n=1 Tax=Pythium insidiosum TaxID=114742 RepID=A0AAD5M5A1_PYTIN|nr:hypothetical protein P43SY_005940 [Pythium insidiosum]
MTPALRRVALWRALRASQRTPVSRYAAVAPRTGFLRSYSQSASAVASFGGESSVPKELKRRVPSTLGAATSPVDPNDLEALLEQSIARRDPSEALAYFNCLDQPPSVLTSQRLAVLLAKQRALHQTRRALEIMQAVFGAPQFSPDDYTQLACIHIVDACVQQDMVQEALEVFQACQRLAVSLDLGAYSALVSALVQHRQLDQAAETLRSIVTAQLVALPEDAFGPLLAELMAQGKYEQVTELIDHGRKHAIKFTFVTYDPLVEMAENVDDSDDDELWERLEQFMTYINAALEEDGLTAFSDEDMDDDGDGITLEVAMDDDDDDEEDDDEHGRNMMMMMTMMMRRQCGGGQRVIAQALRHRRPQDAARIRGAAFSFATPSHALSMLEQCLEKREATEALRHFNCLQAPPSQLLSQKLAMLLAKRGDREQTERAVQILKSVFVVAQLKPDDYTKLASIYVVDACLRHGLLDDAMDIYDEAYNVGVTVDLPAYDSLVQALVAADRVDEATTLLQDLLSGGDVKPTERSFFPLLHALVERQDYQAATAQLETARTAGVEFTSETFYPLVELAEADDQAGDSIISFLSYVEQVWDEAKAFDELIDTLDVDDEDAMETVVRVEDDDDDDDDDDTDFQS